MTTNDISILFSSFYSETKCYKLPMTFRYYLNPGLPVLESDRFVNCAKTSTYHLRKFERLHNL